MRAFIEAQLSTSLDTKLVHELLEAHAEAKRNFYLGGLRLTEVEGGRFCEAAFRLLEQEGKMKVTPLGKQLDTDRLIRDLSNLPSAQFNESVRLHIPRSLRLVYDIRNKRDAAHLADGIDPNVQDATLVVSVIDWVLAEFIRRHHDVSADEASTIVNEIVTRVAPVVQDFNGFLKVLNPKFRVADHCVVLLYQRGIKGATFNELKTWARPKMRANLQRALDTLVNVKDFAHFDGSRYFITRNGEHHVEHYDLITSSHKQ